MHIKNQWHIYRQCRRAWHGYANIQFVRIWWELFMRSKSLWNCHRDEVNDEENENNSANNRINSNKTTLSKSL